MHTRATFKFTYVLTLDNILSLRTNDYLMTVAYLEFVLKLARTRISVGRLRIRRHSLMSFLAALFCFILSLMFSVRFLIKSPGQATINFTEPHQPIIFATFRLGTSLVFPDRNEICLREYHLDVSRCNASTKLSSAYCCDKRVTVTQSSIVIHVSF